jgi:signal transduction histidine kinase
LKGSDATDVFVLFSVPCCVQFIRYVFHEVRVPFSAMLLGVEQLCDVWQPENDFAQPDRNGWLAMKDTVDILLEQADCIKHILDDVLSMQKIEEGKMKLEVRDSVSACCCNMHCMHIACRRASVLIPVITGWLCVRLCSWKRALWSD